MKEYLEKYYIFYILSHFTLIKGAKVTKGDVRK